MGTIRFSNKVRWLIREVDICEEAAWKEGALRDQRDYYTMAFVGHHAINLLLNRII